jgi:hypothetical protein
MTANGMHHLSADAPQQDGESIRGQLSDLEGVDQVVIDSTSRQIWLILRPAVDSEWLLQHVRELVEGFAVNVAYRPEHRDRQRVRFVEVQRSATPDQQVSFRVTLEWAGTEYHGSATGDTGASVELRTIAAASLDAASAIIPGGLPIKLAGVKQLRAFDADLIVVSLYRPDSAPHNLVGAVVTGSDSDRAGVVAVLTALNRLLGNYLTLP